MDNILLEDGFNVTIINNVDIWINFQGPNKNNYKARIGTGGAISNLLNEDNNELLSPSYKEEKTDRIIQWTIWGNKLKSNDDTLEDFAKRYNVTQGGDGDGNFAPSVKVEIYDNGIDVWSLPIDNWIQSQQKHFKGGFATLTRYRVIGPGLLFIRRIFLVKKIFLDNKESKLGDTYIEAWTPVTRKIYNAYALSVHNLVPVWWYAAGYNIPTYPNFNVKYTDGYALAYNSNNVNSDEVFGFIYGKKDIEMICFDKSEKKIINTTDNVGEGLANSMSWDTGIGILPAININNLEEDDIIDVSHIIALGKGITTNIMNAINKYQQMLPSPKLWKKDTTNSDNIMRDIKHRLHNLDINKAKRVDHLAQLIS